MSVRFSLVYPTRHRPAFIRQALRFLEKQKYQNFEVIVSDNYIDPTLSCEAECRNSPLANLVYVRPPKPVGMVESWNYPLQFASGDYICYFTDKMFLLPDTLSAANLCIEQSRSEIVNWVDNMYTPKQFPDYFGEGIYTRTVKSTSFRAGFNRYNPLVELSKKGNARVSRYEQDRSSYIRGKICFGSYSAELCNRIIKRTSALFHNMSPDYTSMVLGLSMTESAAELSQPGIVHVNTDLSNGGQSAVRDEVALKFLNALDNPEELFDNFLVPQLYSASHNVVSHDYLALRKKYNLDFQFDPINWLVYISEDLDIQGRQWSSKEVEIQQRELLERFVGSLPKSEQKKYRVKCQARRQKKEKLAAQAEQNRQYTQARVRQYVKKIIKDVVRAILPQKGIEKLKNWLFMPVSEELPLDQREPGYSSTIEEILK